MPAGLRQTGVEREQVVELERVSNLFAEPRCLALRSVRPWTIRRWLSVHILPRREGFQGLAGGVHRLP